MDTAKLEALEIQIAQLLQAFIRSKEENTQLRQRLAQLQQMLHDQQHSLERWQADQEELASLRTLLQALQRERELIRSRLEELLVVIERLEGFSHVPSDSQV
jgi:predicted RNase H-like nuclease (RuvC/YqgF family)